MAKHCFIYALADPRFPSVIRYIGKTKYRLRHRLLQHIACRDRHKCHRSTWIKSLITQGREPIIWPIEKCDYNGWEERERFWISFFKPTGWLTNHSAGGVGANDVKYKNPSEVFSRRGHRLGKKLTPEQKIRQAMLLSVYPRTARQKEQILECIRSGFKSVTNVLTGEVFESLSAAARKYNGKSSKISLAIERNGTAYGQTWKYSKSRAKVLVKKAWQYSEKRKRIQSRRTKGKPMSDRHRNQILTLALSTCKPVKCVETGEVFSSACEASRKIGLSVSRVGMAIRSGNRSGGKHWIYI